MGRYQLRLDWLNPLILTLIFIVIAASWKFVQPMLYWPVSEVRVIGNVEHTEPEQLQYMLARTLLPGFLASELDDVKNGVESLPWVASVDVKRVWPEQIELRLTEKNVVANWLQNGLLDSNLEPFFPGNRDGFESLPRLAGPPGSEKKVWEVYTELDKSLKSTGLEPDVLSLAGYGAWSLHIKDGPWVLLGRDHSAANLIRLKQVYEKLNDRWSEIRLVDMRYPNGFAVEWLQ